MGEGPLLEVAARDREPELWNVETGELVPLGRGSVVHRGGGWVLWASADGTLMRVIDLVCGIVGDVVLGELGGFTSPVTVGDRFMLQGCYAPFSAVIDPVTLTTAVSPPICEIVATDDGRFVVGATTPLPDEWVGGCSTPMVVEQIGVDVVQTFPSGCPLAWLVEP